MIEINSIKLAKCYFEIVSPELYDFEKREKNGYDAARKQLARLIKKRIFDKDAMRQGIAKYKLSIIEEHESHLRNVDEFERLVLPVKPLPLD